MGTQICNGVAVCRWAVVGIASVRHGRHAAQQPASELPLENSFYAWPCRRVNPDGERLPRQTLPHFVVFHTRRCRQKRGVAMSAYATGSKRREASGAFEQSLSSRKTNEGNAKILVVARLPRARGGGMSVVDYVMPAAANMPSGVLRSRRAISASNRCNAQRERCYARATRLLCCAAEWLPIRAMYSAQRASQRYGVSPRIVRTSRSHVTS